MNAQWEDGCTCPRDVLNAVGCICSKSGDCEWCGRAELEALYPAGADGHLLGCPVSLRTAVIEVLESTEWDRWPGQFRLRGRIRAAMTRGIRS